MSKVVEFKELRVYVKARELAKLAYKLSAQLPVKERYSLTDQLRRAATSVCLNIAEGHGRGQMSKVEFRRYLFISVGSVNEVRACFDLVADFGYLDKEYPGMVELDKEYSMLSRMLMSFVKKLDVQKDSLGCGSDVSDLEKIG